MSLAVRTMTARCTSPFFTLPRGAASLTDTTITSPTPATRRFEPPSTLMHWTRLAPLLSATSRLDCIWIIDPVPSQWLAGTLAFLGSAVPNSLRVARGGHGLDFEVGLDGPALAGLD